MPVLYQRYAFFFFYIDMEHPSDSILTRTHTHYDSVPVLVVVLVMVRVKLLVVVIKVKRLVQVMDNPFLGLKVVKLLWLDACPSVVSTTCKSLICIVLAVTTTNSLLILAMAKIIKN